MNGKKARRLRKAIQGLGYDENEYVRDQRHPWTIKLHPLSPRALYKELKRRS